MFSCASKHIDKKITLSTDISHDCILSYPTADIPMDLYSIGDIIINSDEYLPFSKQITVCGITLIARDDISNNFMNKVANTIYYMFSITSYTDTLLQQQLIQNLFKYKTVIPLFYGEEWNISNSEGIAFDETKMGNSLCDIIMEDVPNQVMEVIEHILHHISNIGLHYTMNKDWGLSGESKLYKVTKDAIASGDYNISQYSDISDTSIRNRVILQEYAYWIIYTAWDLRNNYGPSNSEWSIFTKNEFKKKQPRSYELFINSIPKVLTCPADSLLNLF